MKKVLIITVCAVVVLCSVAWVTYNMLSNHDENAADNSRAIEKEATEKVLHVNRKDIQGTISKQELVSFKEKGLNPFGESTIMQELTDYIYQEYIHGMSHQKIEASKKWGFYEIHPSRIKWLIEGLEQVNLEHEKMYQEILQKWNNKNFTSIDDDHNTIWSLQGGTVGRATGILNANEEQAYINNNSD
ncbi:DUF6241 domain-containing protein [Virgibacillus sp. DJP39]|uniref:DUF6241 domain-containing protein n=1 Tax=Virgibacillus sp. DJP39 TaxID=3409790 RepID=UPI003BB4BC28